MKYALLSRDARHAYLLHALAVEGHEVKLLSRANTGAWEGMIDRLPDLAALQSWGPDLVIIDTPGFGPLAKKLQDDGVKVFGGSKLADRLSQNYLYGLSLLEAAGVPTVEHSRFTDLADAIDYTIGKNQPWALRTPSGSVTNFQDTGSLQLHLEALYAGAGLPEFSLQRGYPDVTWERVSPVHQRGEISLNPMFYVCGLFNSTGLMSPCFKMTTAHGLLPHNMGIPTYEGVNLLSVDVAPGTKLLSQLQKTLQAVSYTGWVWLGCTEDWDRKQGFVTRALDFRVSAPDGFWAALLEGLNMGVEAFFDRVMNPRRPNTPFEFEPGASVSRKISIPPYPLTQAPWASEHSLKDLLPDITFHRNQRVHWEGVKLAGSQLTPTSPVLGYVTGRGSDSTRALGSVASDLNALNIPYLQVKVEDGMDQLHLDLLNSAGRQIA